MDRVSDLPAGNRLMVNGRRSKLLLEKGQKEEGPENRVIG